MATIPKYKTLTNNSIDVLNAIRNSASTNYRDYVPVAKDGADFKAIGNIIMDSPSLQNEFLTNLVNRIGLVILSNKEYTNKWAMFKRGLLDYGETIEEIFVELAKPFKYDIEESERKIFAREIPDVRTAFHVMNYQTFYKQTIQRHQLKKAFLNETGMLDLVQKIISSMYSGAEYDEFQMMKYMLARHAVNGRITPIEIPEVSATNMKQIASLIKSTSNAFEFMTDKYNVAGVKNYTEKNNQYLIVNTVFDATMDVEVLASAFNMDKAQFSGQRVLVDSFGEVDEKRLAEIFVDEPNYRPLTPEEKAILADVPAMLVDISYFMIYDNLKEVTEQYNAQGLYWNYWFHVWKTFSVSPFQNACMFVVGTPSVSDVEVTPSTLTLPAGGNTVLKAVVTATNFAPKSVVWTTDNELATINSSGVLTLDESLTSATEIEVTATSTFDKTKKGVATITVG